MSYTPPDRSNFKACRVFSRKEEVVAAMKKLPVGSFVACMVNYCPSSYFIFRTLAKYRIPYSLYRYNYPNPNVQNTSVKSTMRRVRNISPAKLLAHLFYAISTKYIGLTTASIVFSLSAEFSVPKFALGKETKILWSHNFDYEIYLRLKHQPFNSSARTAVFLDQFYPFHPDFLPGTVPKPDEYYPKLCAFFDAVERKYGVQVVIAAHPRSDYDGKEYLFGQRQIVRGKAGRLVQESAFVILHNSASVNFAVLFKKALIFVTLNELPPSERTNSEFMASLFGQIPINLTAYEETDIPEKLIVNNKLYEEYLNRYIKKSGTDDTPPWQLFADYLKKQNESGWK